MILSMEFMDKTFFISAIMEMTHNKWVILVASIAALFLMNGISCAMGVVLPVLMSRTVTISIASVLVKCLLYFSYLVYVFWSEDDIKWNQDGQRVRMKWFPYF